MARIHRCKGDPRRSLGRVRLLAIVCWPAAMLCLTLAALILLDGGERLWALGDGWRQSVTALTARLGDAPEGGEGWRRIVWHGAEKLLRGAGWAVLGLTVAAPALAGLGLAGSFIGAFFPAVKRCRLLRARARETAAAMRLLAPLPDSCHIFLHKPIAFDGGTAEPPLILLGPGGVLVMELRGESGIIEGCVTDAALHRRKPDGDGCRMSSPARLVASQATRLGNYFTSLGLGVHVLPCVLFVHEEASVYVTQPDVLAAGRRRARISACVMTDATSFWEHLGRDFANGHVLNRAMVEQLAQAVRRAPEGGRRGR